MLIVHLLQFYGPSACCVKKIVVKRAFKTLGSVRIIVNTDELYCVVIKLGAVMRLVGCRVSKEEASNATCNVDLVLAKSDASVQEELFWLRLSITL